MKNRAGYILLPVFILGTACLLNAAAPERGTADYARLSLAESYTAKGEYEEAAGILIELRKSYPEDEKITLELAKAYGYGGRLEEAEALFESLPREKEYMLAHASVLEANKEFGGAAGKYEFLMEKEPENVEITLKLARVLYWMGRAGEASGYFEKVLARRPENTEAMLRLAELKAVRGEYAGAISLCEDVLELEPGNTEGMLALARFYSWGRIYPESAGMYDALIENEPDNPLYRREKARVLGWDRKFAASINEYEKLLSELGQDRAVEMEMKAKKYYFRRHYGTAVKYYKKWIEAEPENLEALFDLAQIYSSQKKWEKAEDLYRSILRIMPEHFRAEQALRKVESLSESVSLAGGIEYFDARSDDRNVDLLYYDYSIQAEAPLSERFRIQLGMHETRYRFEEGLTGVRGNSSRGAIRYFNLPRARIEAGLALNEYSGGIDGSTEYNAALHLRPRDVLHLDFSYGRDDIRDNLPALAEGVRKDEYKLRADVLFSRKFAMGADYLRADYNDDNREYRWGADLTAHLSHEPRRLSLLYRYEAYGFDVPSVFYFSPDSFHTHRVRAEWRHYLNDEELFWGAEDIYYSIIYEINFDSGDDAGHRAGIDFYRDVTEKLSLGFRARKTVYSPGRIYRENGAMFFLKYYL